MSVAKAWYKYARNGIIYVQFKDKVTGRKLTAKSTRTRDAAKANDVINELYYNPKSDFNQSQWEKHKELFTPMIQASIQEAVKEAIKTLPLLITPTGNNCADSVPTSLNSYPPEIRAVIDNLDTLTFYEYLLLYWDYAQSPYIKQLTRLGRDIPNPERFKKISGVLQSHRSFFSDSKLTEIKADEINTILGSFKNKFKLKNSTVSKYRSAFTQALNFAYQNNIVTHDVMRGVITFSNKNEEREIFTKAETRKIFNGKTNPFNRLDFYLINKLLFVTGCRVGEILALKQRDIIRTEKGYMLNISKSYNQAGKRLKETKTKRKDYVYISSEMAADLLNFIKTNPFNSDDSFIFYSEKKDHPINYNSVLKNFHSTMKKLGIVRKRLTPHSYRHTYAVFLSLAGYSQAELKYMTRHDSLKELQRYMSHITPELELKNIEAAHLFQKLIA